MPVCGWRSTAWQSLRPRGSSEVHGDGRRDGEEISGVVGGGSVLEERSREK